MNRKTFKTARPVAHLRAGRNDWYRIENKSNGPTEIYIYDEIGFFGVTASDLVKDLGGIKSSEIILHLNTPGGEVFDGIAIYNALRDHKAEVTAIVDGIAASAGSFIFQAGDKRIMNRNSEVMIHDAHGLVIGNAKDMTKMVELLDKMSDNIADIYAERAGGTTEQWREAMLAETWYTADEAVSAGLADEVAGKESKAKNDFDLSIFSYAGREKAPAPTIPDPEPETDWAALASTLGKAFV